MKISDFLNELATRPSKVTFKTEIVLGKSSHKKSTNLRIIEQQCENEDFKSATIGFYEGDDHKSKTITKGKDVIPFIKKLEGIVTVEISQYYDQDSRY